MKSQRFSGRVVVKEPRFGINLKEIREFLGMSQDTISRARVKLQERGILHFTKGKGNKNTHYILLQAIILPEKKVSAKSGVPYI